LKTFIKYLLQRILGFRNYLYLFSLFIIRKLRWDNYEKDFLHFLGMLPEEGTVLDIGANLGVMTYYLAKNHSMRRIFSFEPIPYNYRNLVRLKKKFRLTNVNTFQVALGNVNGFIDMVLPVKHAVRFHGLAHVKHDTVDEKNSDEIFRCPIRRLDDIEELNKDGIIITGIKIDVENYEFVVLKGAEKLLRKYYPVIYCELWDNENRTHTLKFLKEIGYKVFILENATLLAYDPANHKTQNFFFVKK
jgi:FkbM family methyltransferase